MPDAFDTGDCSQSPPSSVPPDSGAGETVARAKAELLDDAIRDMLDFTVGWCSDKLSDADKLERIRVIGERAISSKASD